ncbi:MAG: shikimate dehydrogenase family protein [Alphaproteobacteria bacterium]
MVAIPTGAARLCFSLATRPGRFGATVHNTAFRALGLDFFYKPLAIGENDLARAVEAMRLLDARGFAVTMPFKERILPLLDALDPVAEAVGAVNTVVNDDGRLTGYNTDVDGAAAALTRIGVGTADRVLILGAGGVARAIVAALKTMGITQLFLACRRPETALWASGVRVVPWDEAINAEVLVNATPIGMGGGEDLPIAAGRLAGMRAVMDVVAQPARTTLIRAAEEAGKTVADGDIMALAQAIRQFELYTGIQAPSDVMAAAAAGLRTAVS